MSKILYVHFRKPTNIREKINRILFQVSPNEVSRDRINLIQNGNTYIGVVNYNRSVQLQNCSLCNCIPPIENDWWENSDKDEINGVYYRILQVSNSIRIITDSLATKSLWYVITDDFFAVSSSQRMLVALLGNFQFNKKVIPWMLSSGIILNESWDKRIRMVSYNEKVIFDIKEWKLIVKAKRQQPFSSKRDNIKKVTEELFSELDKCCDKIANLEDIGLPISGGYDSRCLFLLLNKKVDITCLTWGHSVYQNKKYDDLNIAKSLTKLYKTKHLIFDTALNKKYTPEYILNKFLEEGEGRVDHLGAHFDGFLMWEKICKEGITNLIRGDEVFGWVPVFNEADSIRSVGINMISDQFPNDLLRKFDLCTNDLPAYLLKDPEESTETYRDRLYQQFRIPYVIGPLNDLVSGYVEIHTPFLQNNIVKLIKQLPDKYRTNKFIFKKYLKRINPKIPFAKDFSRLSVEEVASEELFIKMIIRELNSEVAKSLFNKTFLDYLKDQLSNKDHAFSYNRKRRYLRYNLSKATPRPIKSLLRKFVAPATSSNLTAIRVVLVCKMCHILNTDSQLNV